MKMVRPNAHVWLLVLLKVYALAFVCGFANFACGQSEDKAAEQPSPVTTADATVPLEHLELLVKPLTKEELVVEADAWRDLLKAQVQEIAELRIEVKDQGEAGSRGGAGRTS